MTFTLARSEYLLLSFPCFTVSSRNAASEVFLASLLHPQDGCSVVKPLGALGDFGAFLYLSPSGTALTPTDMIANQDPSRCQAPADDVGGDSSSLFMSSCSGIIFFRIPY